MSERRQQLEEQTERRIDPRRNTGLNRRIQHFGEAPTSGELRDDGEAAFFVDVDSAGPREPLVVDPRYRRDALAQNLLEGA